VIQWSASEIDIVPVSGLIPYARNAKRHPEAQIAQLAAAIREWGFTVPILVDEAGGIIAGHGRVLAAQKIGLTEVPVIVAKGWSDAKKRAYILADNRLSEGGQWDAAVLRAELDDLAAGGYDLDLTGFGAMPEPPGAAEDAAFAEEMAAPVAPEKAITKQYNENYEAVIVVCENTIDYNRMRELMGLREHRQDGKTGNFRKANVLSVKEFFEKWDAR